MPIVLKSGNLNYLERSGPLQACNGTDLPLPLHLPTTKRTRANLNSRQYARFRSNIGRCSV